MSEHTVRSAVGEVPCRFHGFAERVSRLFDVRPHRAVALLELIDDPTCWLPGPAKGIDLFPVHAGPKLEGVETCILRAEPGSRLPHREHAGEELMLMLQGAFRADSGVELRPGDTWTRGRATPYGMTALPGDECICCVATSGGAFDPEAAD